MRVRIAAGCLLIGMLVGRAALATSADHLLVEARPGQPAAIQPLPAGAVAAIVPDPQGGAPAVRVSGADDEPERVLIELTAPPLVRAAAAVTAPGSRRLATAPGAARAAVAGQQARVEAALQGIVRGGARGAGATVAIRHRYQDLFNGFALRLTRREQAEVRRLADVAAVHPDAPVRANLDVSVPLVGAPAFWSAYALSGDGATIAVVDTGVYYPHPDLGGCFGPGCKVIGGRDFVNDDGDPIDDNGHGTHVAATAAGDGLLAGMAPAARILAYKVLGAGGSGFVSDVIRGVERAVADGADVINLSLGSAGDADDPMSLAVDSAVAAGVVVVASAGNAGSGFARIGSPGAAREAITVAATDDLDAAARFSSGGPAPRTLDVKPDLAAPGVSICAANSAAELIGAPLGPNCLDATHMQISGTSMAAPHVSGAAALLVSLFPGATPHEIKSLLVNNAADIGLPVLTAGAGRLDVLAAAAAETTITPSSLSFGRNEIGQPTWEEERSFTVRNDGATPRAYTLSTPPVHAAVTAVLTPAAFTLAPGASRVVTLALEANNTALTPITVAPYAYEGVVRVESGGQTQRIPFAFVTLSRLTLRFDRQPDIVVIHGDTGFYNNAFPSSPTISLAAIPGTYDVIWQIDGQTGSSASMAWFVKEGIVVTGDTSASLTTPRRQHLVTFRPTDVRGDPLVTYTRTATIRHKDRPAGIIADGYVGGRPNFARVTTGDIPPSYRLDFSITQHRRDGTEQYLASASLLDGISSDVILDAAKPFVESSVRYYPRPGQSAADVRIFPVHWLFFWSTALSHVFSGTAPEGLQRTVYLSPSADAANPHLLRFEVYPHPFDGQGYRSPSPTYSVQAETLALHGGVVPGTITGHNDFDQEEVAALYQDGEEIPVGLGPNFWRLRTINSDHVVALGLPFGHDPGGVHAFASQSGGRAVDLLTHSATWELRAGSTLVGTGLLPQLYSEKYREQLAPDMPAPPDVYTLSAVGPAHWVGGVEGSTAFEATFDTRPPSGPLPYDPDPPWMSSIKILSGGVPTDHAYADGSYTVEAVIRDDTGNGAGSGIADVSLTVVTPGGDIVIPATPLGDDRWSMAVAGGCVPGPVDLTITATDVAGNRMRQAFRPALVCVSATCGNGALDAGESCDDGNREPFDCCSAQCAYEAVGTRCTSDGNECTGDRCDGAGSCTHDPETPHSFDCDDGDACTVTDRCRSGICKPGGMIGAYDVRISARIVPGAANDRMTIRATPDGQLLGNLPTETGMELRLLDAGGTALYTAVLPASHWTDKNGVHGRFMFKDRQRSIASANGVVTAKLTWKRAFHPDLKVTIKGATLDALVGQPTVALQVRLGSGIGADCAADPEVRCTTLGSSISCRRR